LSKVRFEILDGFSQRLLRDFHGRSKNPGLAQDRGQSSWLG